MKPSSWERVLDDADPWDRMPDRDDYGIIPREIMIDLKLHTPADPEEARRRWVAHEFERGVRILGSEMVIPPW